MIERYVQGQMTNAEQREFEQLLASNESLRTLVVAEQRITSALQADKRAVPLIAVEPAAHLLATLHATPARSTGGQPEGFWSRFSLWSAWSWVVVFTSVATVGTVAGALFFPFLSPSPKHSVPVAAPAVEPLGTEPAAIAFPPSAPHDVPKQYSTPSAKPNPRNRRDKPVARSPVVRAESAPAIEGTTDVLIRIQQKESHDKERTMLKDLLKQSESAPVGIKRSDSVEIQVKVGKE